MVKGEKNMIELDSIENVKLTKYKEGQFFIFDKRVFVLIDGELQEVTLKPLKQPKKRGVK